MAVLAQDILSADGAIARRLGDRYEHRPQQLELAAQVERALADGRHLIAEAGTGTGKSFAYLLPVIEYAVRKKKRVVVSTHTIALQEQLIEKDIPLIRSVYPDEFTAVLVKGRGNYLCKRRLQQARGRQGMLFDQPAQLESLWMIEDWAARTTDGSLADLPTMPEPGVWDRVAAEHGNCLGKRCEFYESCFWQAAKRRMQSGNVLVVNHALFFSDLALRMAGVNYLPKYDVVVLDEAHTVEDVAGQHFGLKLSEASLRYNLRTLYDPRRGRGMLSVYGSNANPAISDVIELYSLADLFFERCLEWHEQHGRGSGRVREKDFVPNGLSPKLRDLSLHLKAMLPELQEQEMTEVSAMAAKIGAMAETLHAIVAQTMDDAVYWVEASGKTPSRVTLSAAPINVATGLKQALFDRMHSVIMTSATLCTGGGGRGNQQQSAARRGGNASARGAGVSPAFSLDAVVKREGRNLPHWTTPGGIYSVTFRLADSLPAAVIERYRLERAGIIANAQAQGREPTEVETDRLRELYSMLIDKSLDDCAGECVLREPEVGRIVADALDHFADDRYTLVAWCVMPNHVHVVLRPLDGFALDAIVHSWKSFTAHRINALLGRTGSLWQDEYYDHLVRDMNDLERCVGYVWTNAEAAGLAEGYLRGKVAEPLSVVAESLNVSSPQRGRDARATVGEPDRDEPPPPPDPAFDYIRRRIGATDAGRVRTLCVGSPFDYAAQATLYIEADLPEPSDDRRFAPLAGERIVHYLRQTRGGAFVLFTSYRSMVDMANRLKPRLDELGLPLLVQGQGAPRKVLLERFRDTSGAVLFGTASFWQGIDVRGEALRNVIIVKLPFAVPDEPITEARLEAIERSGGNPFMEYSVPEAVIKLKQGFGRLIRSRTDKGIVVLLDSRVLTKRYGKAFLESLPPARRVIVTERDHADDAF